MLQFDQDSGCPGVKKWISALTEEKLTGEVGLLAAAQRHSCGPVDSALGKISG